MQLANMGGSPVADFALCAGLGVAGASAFIALVVAVRTVLASGASNSAKNLLRTASFLLFTSAQVAIAVFIGATASARNSNSLLGFPVGLFVVAALAVLVGKLKSSSQRNR